MPALLTISPDDFRYAADYLSTGTFGIRVIDDGNRDTAMAECMAAWEVADRLGMEDLLDLVIAKSRQAMPWSLEEVSVYASIVYRTADSLLDSHATMKYMLAEFIAENFYDYLDQFGEMFTTGMRKFPELERDVFKKLADLADKRLQAEDEED